MAFPGGGPMGMGGGQQGNMDPQQAQQQMMVKYVCTTINTLFSSQR
jgi:hypothetical protein